MKRQAKIWLKGAKRKEVQMQENAFKFYFNNYSYLLVYYTNIFFCSINTSTEKI